MEIEINNSWRADTAQKVLNAFIQETDVDKEDAPGDLLASLTHWCDREGCDFDLALDRARAHHAEESSEKKPGLWAEQIKREPRDTKRKR